MRSRCLSHSTPSLSVCLICTTWRGVKIRTVSTWSGGLWGAWSVSGWATVDPHFLAWETGETFMTCIWEGGFMVEWHDMTAEWRVPRGGRMGEGGTTNICMLTAHRQTHKETHRKCIESHGLSAFGFALCFCFISFTTFVAVVVVCFGFFVPFWPRIRKSFESPLNSAVWMHSWMLFGGAFFFFFNFAFAFV